MPRFEIDLNPVQHITVDAIGQPGARVFYIQGWTETDPKPVTIIIEKIQLKALADGVDTLFAEIARKDSGQNAPVVKVDAEKMTITPPVDPVFRAGELGQVSDQCFADHLLSPKNSWCRCRCCFPGS
jgi:uncharacterized repeat protein (TIGR03847 family)